MVFHFFTALFVYIRFHGNWPNDRLLTVSMSFRGMLPVVMGRPFGAFRPLDRRGLHLHNKLVPLRPGTFAFC